jgi:hypothetical protein
MTREEAKKVIRKMLSVTDLTVRGNLTHEMCEACNMAIKALEQESILDKIRAEIDNALSDGMVHKKTVLGIIDKYKEESEDL